MMNQSVAVDQDRRGIAPGFRDHWETLTAEQKMSLYQLQTWGYRLLFVRNMPSGPLAIIAQDQEIATIDTEGTLNTHPDIHLRPH
ncbi:hypothetical protein KJI95_05830 [Shewanella sp. JM162201]|uniref:DUF4224 domain-containing protein n=1 Tax=Shewanella jiangmenensis TaxID=2837387 RepID=A0ABS5V2J5_9GAMM|nr:hypothetical protein [Shewanella jiangmenensis]MBT1444041.1 hypothetical protein [Shewanella jiangmenensis]